MPGTAPTVMEYRLSIEEIEFLRRLAASLAGTGRDIDDADFLTRIAGHAPALPHGLRGFLRGFRDGDRPACLVRGLPIDEARMGPSPTVCNRLRDKAFDEIRLEVVLVLLGSCLGDIFGWRLQHEGSVVHDLAPRPEHEALGFGTGSRQHINWHTEDSFHPYRADYLGLFCVRNTSGVTTTVGALDAGRLSAHERRLLFAPVFTFRPDPSYLTADASPLPDADLGGILFGDPGDPFLRFDQDYIEWPDVEGIGAAVEALRRAVEASLVDLPLRAGDFLLLDNRRAVHGRPAFVPTYRGADRWVKRINITRDLRRSRPRRRSDGDRVIHI
ncbi:TauD/TfdA family dioxygenase [Nocardia aurantia]|uniref:L-ornithine/L-arginine 3-hydroxylase n=1 Tax=Nocardia aurantia TaxID=2585199 RepID=A0A7K0DKL7_9NOCA|nr:TauD/TfdA family dioxygenase [Nocardia aurantia]MQY26326.1 L-ornithine/L-arginine 3-hydroxylase [Nocardia aurantia]